MTITISEIKIRALNWPAPMSKLCQNYSRLKEFTSTTVELVAVPSLAWLKKYKEDEAVCKFSTKKLLLPILFSSQLLPWKWNLWLTSRSISTRDTFQFLEMKGKKLPIKIPRAMPCGQILYQPLTLPSFRLKDSPQRKFSRLGIPQ
jgi:hypothetical protein